MLNWYVTNKLPLRDRTGRVIGLIATIQAYRGLEQLPMFGAELRGVVEFIYAHLDQPLHVPQLAALAGVSSRQIERRFRDAVAMSPKEFIVRARLDEACRRLRESSTPVGRIAIELGFYDQSAFTRLFCKHLGMTPREFRKARGTS